MVDTGVMLRAWLLQQGAITELIGTGNAAQGIYAMPDLPENFDPANGPGLQLHTLGGPKPHTELITIVDEKIQLRAWADKKQYTLARQLYGLARDVMHGACGVDLTPNGFIIRCIEILPGQDISDPDIGWASVIAQFQVMARASS